MAQGPYVGDQPGAVAVATHAQVGYRPPPGGDPLGVTTPGAISPMAIQQAVSGASAASGPGLYNPGDAVEVWSSSLRTWCAGVVDRTEAGMALVCFKSPDGQPLSKGVPMASDNIRPATGAPAPKAAAPCQVAAVPAPKAETKAAAPPPGQPKASGPSPVGSAANQYKPGDAVEVWSNSRKDWFDGEVINVQGAMVEVLFMGPDGKQLNKGVSSLSDEIRFKKGFTLPEALSTAVDGLVAKVGAVMGQQPPGSGVMPEERLGTKPASLPQPMAGAEPVPHSAPVPAVSSVASPMPAAGPGSPKGQRPPAESTFDLAERQARPSLGKPPNMQGVFVDASVDLAGSGANFNAVKRAAKFSQEAMHGAMTPQIMNNVDNPPEIVRPAKFDANPQASRLANHIVSQAVQMTLAVGQESFDLQDKQWQGPMSRDPLPQLLGDSNPEVITQGLESLAQEVQVILASQPMLVEAEAPVKVFGDIHGQFRDMLVLFARFGFPQAGGPMFIFNGDWLDRGAHQLEVVGLVLALKAVFPMRVWLIRGNHEDMYQNQAMGPVGFHNHCMQRLGQQLGCRVFSTIHTALCYLPFACLVNKRILVVHGGIGDGRWTLDHIRNQRPPIDHDGLVRDPVLFNVLWSDPIPDNPQMELDTCGVHASPRDGHQNLIVTFAKDVSDFFCSRNGIALVVRSHQALAQGHGYDVMHGGRCVRVFSARDYEGAGNDSAILSIYEAIQPKSQTPAIFLRAQVLGSVFAPKPYV
mmetsp:Transcript_10767/g.24590  ORF Transcript_10767/g.24590 Transcript_10767/m.24590 type:complete len:751 (-) Transcript_10767:69-2321(-)